MINTVISNLNKEVGINSPEYITYCLKDFTRSPFMVYTFHHCNLSKVEKKILISCETWVSESTVGQYHVLSIIFRIWNHIHFKRKLKKYHEL